MYDTDIKSGIETSTYLHSNSSHKGVVCVKVCIGFSARLFVLSVCNLKSIKIRKGGHNYLSKQKIKWRFFYSAE